MAMATANPPQFITDWYHSCIVTFDTITTGVDKLTPALDSRSDEALALQLVKDQLGRFRVWAGNMGAHHPARNRMSLDYKLAEASHIHNKVVELLEELNTSLEMLCSTQDSIEEAEETDDDDEGMDSNEEGFDDNVSDSGSTSSSPLSDLVFKLDDIAHIISCLYTLSVAMRQPALQGRLRKYAEIDMSHYEFFDNQHVLEKFPGAHPLLIKRLVNANTQRRQYFRYRLLHHEKIAKGLDMGPASSADKLRIRGLHTDPGQDNYMSSRRETNQDARTVITPQDTGTVITSTTISIIPKDTKLPALDAIEAESDAGKTATSYGSIMETGSSGVKLLRVPDPPDADNVFAGNAFQCPYCYSLIMVNNSKAWQRHVFRDLRPYICTFDSCAKPNRLFETRHDWYSHEVRHHRREWYCAECAIACSTSSDFTRHLKELHPALLVEEKDISALVGNCERVLSTPQQCPLCTVQSEHTRLQSHLGRHMQQLALFTLPRLEIDDNGGEDFPSEAGLVGRESTGSGEEQDEEGMSELDFDSNPSEGRPGNEMKEWEEEVGSKESGGARLEDGPREGRAKSGEGGLNDNRRFEFEPPAPPPGLFALPDELFDDGYGPVGGEPPLPFDASFEPPPGPSLELFGEPLSSLLDFETSRHEPQN